jgi:tartrate/fumarate subfamily iron-sulfur-dependent hydro-lyase beta chain
MTELRYPFKEADVRALRAGEAVRLTGRVFTGRDRLHKFLAEGGTCPVELRDGAIFHCGPVVVKDGASWRVVAAGPTTSVREEPYMADVIRRFGVRLVIGKGGMGPKTRAACMECGCAYLQAVGGAAALLARRIKRVDGVEFLDKFGAAEALWLLDVEGLETVVGIDTLGRDVFAEIKAESEKRLHDLIA